MHLKFPDFHCFDHHTSWSDGPTGRMRDSLAPYYQHFVDLYCSGIVKTEILQKNRGSRSQGQLLDHLARIEK